MTMTRSMITLAFGMFLLLGGTNTLRAEETITILPGTISLRGTEARQSILIERQVDSQFVGQTTEPFQLTSSDPAIFRIEGQTIIPVANGKATLTANSADKYATAEVTVIGMEVPFEWSFRHHVQPVLAKSGCNSGACHGALAGKRGFKLSLRGFDATGDFDTLLHQASGRRISLEEPAESLLLTKATAAVPHGGGKRFDPESLDYNVIARWIADGAKPPTDADPRIERVEILPSNVRLTPKSEQQLIVLATFSDGHVEDVTRWAKYTSASADVAEVDDHGKLRVLGYGEGALSVWYSNKIGLASVTVPYEQQVNGSLFADAPKRNEIDTLVLEKLERLNLPPSPVASDEEFVRRVYLDTIGTLPTPSEIRTFLADKSPNKRDALINQLLDRPEFVDYWTYKFCDLLLVNSEKLRPAAMWSYYNWVRSNVAARRPWDDMVRDLLTAQGSTLENGATNFYVLHQDTRELSETVSLAFLGLSINCARCHNHPLERWTNDEYFGLANMLARVRLKSAPGEGNFVVYAAREGDLIQPLRGKPQTPRPLDGQALGMESPDDRRIPLADWVTSPDNPYFARAIANRIWANFMGVGLVEPIDDLRLTNPPSNPKLLDSLAKYVVESDYDLRALMRHIMQSTTYQRSSMPLKENESDRRFYSHYYPRRLMAEVLIDAIAQATGVPTTFPNYPEKWRAIQLPDTKIASNFLDKFGRPKRDATCECERTNAPSMVQALNIANGDTVNEKLRKPGGRVDQILALASSPNEMIEEAYYVAAGRPPGAKEKEMLVKEFQSTPDAERRLFVEDLLWSLLSSKEFLFNH